MQLLVEAHDDSYIQLASGRYTWLVKRVCCSEIKRDGSYCPSGGYWRAALKCSRVRYSPACNVKLLQARYCCSLSFAYPSLPPPPTPGWRGVSIISRLRTSAEVF